MFKFGVASLIWTEDFTEKDLPLIEKAKSLGFDVLDINIAHPFRFPTKAVRDEVQKVGIDVVTTIGMPQDANLIHPDEKLRKHGVDTLKKLVDINMEIGSPIIAGVIYGSWGYLTGKPRTEEEWNWSVEGMREAGEYAKSKGEVILAIEPVNRFETHLINIAEDAVQYCKDVGTGNIKILLDAFHMIREELSFTQAVESCGREYLGYVHVCENNRGIPGTGQVPWKEFFTAMKNIGFEGPMSIESFDPGFEELNRLCAIWRQFADTGEELAVQGLRNLKEIEKSIS
ncbi:MAG: sugar phosphate isomerase/epimerase [Dehalococcoidales bacterium]|nr:sugar phosphate isomerase/epimerase [Dehalococcoidales bacterium]